jgi:hypothetical protein
VKQRVRRLERKLDGKRVSIPQRDGTLSVFTANSFWLQMFLDAATAAKGETPDSPLSHALENATPLGREQIKALIQAEGDQCGDFLRGAGSDEPIEFWTVAEPFPDLSEAPESAENGP